MMNRPLAAITMILLFGWMGLALDSRGCFGEALARSNTMSGLLDRIVAVVNGEVITLSELKQAMAQMRLESDSVGASPIPVEEGEVLHQLIERELQLQLARKRGITVKPEEAEQLLREIRNKNGFYTDEAFQNALIRVDLTPDQYKKGIEEQLMILKLANREARSAILLDEKELREYYQSQLDRYLLPDGIHLRQILLLIPQPELKEAVREKARLLVTRLQTGNDFKSLARQYSQGPEAKDGGDLGFVEKGQMLPEVERVISDLEPGEVSDPVETSAGIHIFRIEMIRAGKQLPFEEVKASIRETLFQERAAQRYQEWLQEIRNAAQVEIKF